jgi:hypothetical protein
LARDCEWLLAGEDRGLFQAAPHNGAADLRAP